MLIQSNFGNYDLSSSRQVLEHSSWIRLPEILERRDQRNARDIECSKIVQRVSFAEFPSKRGSNCWKFKNGKKRSSLRKSVSYYFLLSVPQIPQCHKHCHYSRQYYIRLSDVYKRACDSFEAKNYSIVRQIRLIFESVQSSALSLSLLRRLGLPFKKGPNKVEMCNRVGIHPLQYLFSVKTRQCVGLAKKVRMKRLRAEYFTRKTQSNLQL